MSNNFVGSHKMDPSVWAKELCKQHPEIDEDRLIGWFANSIMAGRDVATSKCADEIDRLKAEKVELLEVLEEILNSNPSILATDKSALRFVQAVEKARKVIGKARGEK